MHDLEPDARAPARRALPVPDLALALLVVVAVLLVHPLGSILRHPFWNDEAWVAVQTKLPLHRLTTAVGSTPLGWATLLRLVPGSGLQRYRVVPLAFSAATAVAAYALVRTLAWGSRLCARIAGTVSAAAIVCVPFLSGRNDLKQYTSDAFFALVILIAAVLAERGRSRRSATALAAVSVVSLPFSSTSAFVAAAAFAGVLVAAIVRRSGARALEIVVAGAAAATLMVAYVLAAVRPHSNAALRAYWAPLFVSGSPRHVVHTIWLRIVALERPIAMPAFVALAFFVVGVVALVRQGQIALAVAVPALGLEEVVLARARQYPLLDERTSVFLLAAALVVATIGFATIVFLVARRSRVVAGLVLAGGAVAFLAGSVSSFGRTHFPAEDVRSQAQYVGGHRTPGDAVVLSAAARYSFAYYWPGRDLVATADDQYQTGFTVRVTDIASVAAATRAYPDIVAALQAGVADVRGGGRLWIVRTRMTTDERAAWDRAFAVVHLDARRIKVGPESLLVARAPVAG